MSRKVLKFLWDNFIAGIVVILPVTITILIIRFIVTTLNNIMLNPVALKLRPYLLHEAQRLLLAKFAVFVVAILIVLFIGLMTRIIIIRRTFSFFEKFLYKLPMINKIYGAIKDISYAFLGNKKTGFKKVVMVEYPRKGIYTIGFITSEVKGRLKEIVGDGEALTVYIPTTPNPTSGLFVILKKEETIPIDLSVEEALKIVVSAGAITPPYRGSSSDAGGSFKRADSSEHTKV